MATWQDVLKDRKQFPDDLKVNLNGTEVSIGDVRSFVETQSASVAAREAELQKAQAETAKFYADLLETQKSLEGKTPPNSTTVPQNGQPYNYKNDPLLGPLYEKFEGGLSEAMKKAEAAEQKLAEQQKQFNQVSAYYLNKEWERDFAAIADKPKDLTLKQALEFATKEKLVDEMGIPSVRKAVEKLAEPLRIEAAEQKGYEKGLAKAKAEQAIAAIGRPGLSGVRTATADPKQKSYGTLDEAIAAAHQDPEIAAMISNLGPDSLQ